jgi:hypothetical protein
MNDSEPRGCATTVQESCNDSKTTASVVFAIILLFGLFIWSELLYSGSVGGLIIIVAAIWLLVSMAKATAA